MIPQDFPEANVTYAKDQPQYLPLPAYREGDETGRVVVSWKPTWKERWRLFFGGCLWLEILTFNNGFCPIKPGVDKPKMQRKPSTK